MSTVRRENYEAVIHGKYFFSIGQSPRALASGYACHDNGNGAVHLGVCGWLGGFFYGVGQHLRKLGVFLGCCATMNLQTLAAL
jgi:hypothetical protein